MRRREKGEEVRRNECERKRKRGRGRERKGEKCEKE